MKHFLYCSWMLLSMGILGCAENPVESSLSFSVSASTVNPGDSVTLSWIAENADQCSASGAWSGAKSSSGNAQSSPLNQDSTFILSCKDLQGQNLVQQREVKVVASGGGSGGGGSGNGGGGGTPTPQPASAWYSGEVFGIDSSYVQSDQAGTVALYHGSLTANEITTGLTQGTLNAVDQWPLQRTGACSWGYPKTTPSPGSYTVALSYNGAVVVAQSFDASQDMSLLPGLVYQVGPGKTFATPSQAVLAAEASALAVAGVVIEIDAGDYIDDVFSTSLSNVTFRGVNGRAHMKFTGSAISNGKAIWVLKGSRVKVENIEFSGAKVTDTNGSGIRRQSVPGDVISLCNVYMHDNQSGFLGHGGKIIMEFSEFANNGFGDGYSHNIYIDDNAGDTELLFYFNYSHHANVGHTLKTRAKVNDIRYNRLMDEASGQSSYLLDMPNGGDATVIGNVIQQGGNSKNNTLVSYGTTLLRGGDTLLFAHNTLVNDYGSGNFIFYNSATPVVEVQDNLLVGINTSLIDANLANTNVVLNSESFQNTAGYDYHLTAQSQARDFAGAAPLLLNQVDVTPVYEYVYDLDRGLRADDGMRDAGAFEYVVP